MFLTRQHANLLHVLLKDEINCNPTPKLHRINSDIKYTLKQQSKEVYTYLSSSEIQFLLHVARKYLEDEYIYDQLKYFNLDIHNLSTYCVNNGTLRDKISFLRLSIFKNERRKLLKRIKKVESLIKVLKRNTRRKHHG